MNQRYLFSLLFFFSCSVLAAAPIAICEASVNVSLPIDDCTVDILPYMIDAGSYDPSGSSYVAKWVPDGTDLGPGTHTVTLHVWSNGVTNTCWSIVHVMDKTDPEVTCTNQTVYLVAPDQPVTYNVDNLISYTDNCGGFSDVSFNTIDISGFGTAPFSASVTDLAGNSDNCYGIISIVDAEPQNYCSAVRNSYFEHIANLTLTTSSGTVSHNSSADGGYNWHYPTTGNTLYHGFNYTLSYTPGFAFPTSYHEYWSVYIDKNADGDFNDSGELLHRWNGYGGNSFSFSSPGAVWGWSRIRVVMSYGGYAGPCGGGYGETEDISVYLRPYFFLPFPGFRAAGEQITENAAAEHNLEITPAENRPEEAPMANELSKRLGFEVNVPTTPSTTTPTEIDQVTLYPNPVQAGQTITLKGYTAAKELHLFNLNGQQVATYTGRDQELAIPAQLPSGIYLLRSPDWTRRVIVR
ncbi:MAG: T9SS type A sorting domain-containing protein [Bacteroidota bacterium]